MAELIDTTFYMACLKLTDRPCLVVGGGNIALEKIDGLLVTGAKVHVIATRVSDAVQRLADEGTISLEQRPVDPAVDLEGYFLVIAATDDTAVNTAVYEAGEQRAQLVNVVDVPPLCNFILPAIVRTGPIAIAISTAGASPALAKRMKRQIAELFGTEYARLAVMLNEVRAWAKQTLPTYNDRKDFFEGIVNGEPDPIALLRAGDEAAVRALIAEHQERATLAFA